MDKYEDNYLGFKINGERLPKAGDSTIWLFTIDDENDQRIFEVRLKVSRNALMNLVSENKDENEFILEEGLKRVHGRITLFQFKKDTEYLHYLQIDGEVVEPPLNMQEPPFNSEEKKIKFYLLESLARIRKQLLPIGYKSAWVDIDSFCQLLGVSEKSMKATIGILYDHSYIHGITTQSAKRYGDFDFNTLYITTNGLDEFERFSVEIRSQWEQAMPDLVGNATLVLQCMYEAGATSGTSDIIGTKLMKLSGFSPEDYNQVDDYLLGAGYTEGTMGSLEGRRWMTPKGIEKYKVEIAKKEPLSFNAIRIARFLGDKNLNNQQDYVSNQTVLSEIGLDEKDYRIACQELEDQGMLDEQKFAVIRGETIPYASISLSRKGRNAYRRNFIKDDTIKFQQQVGTIFQGPVSDSNILSIANVANSNIQQAIQEGDPSSLREEINQIVEKIVEAVKSDLKVDELSKYSTAALELKNEIAKSEPDPTVIQRLLGTIRFAGDVDGAIELGKKGLELAVKFGPLLLPLQQAILKLLELL